MRMKVNVYCRGFRVTTDVPNKSYKKDLFKPFDPAIAKEFRDKQSQIQNIVADMATAVPDNITDSKSPITILSGGSLTTPIKALAALTELAKAGLLRDDRTIDLCNWKKTPEYAKIMAEAVAAGATHFRAPCAQIKVTLYLREEDEQFVFNNYPDDILKNVDIFRETPLEVAPIYEIAKHARSLIHDTIVKTSEAKSKWFDTWMRGAANSLESSIDILESMELSTNFSQQMRNNLRIAMHDAAREMIAFADAGHHYTTAKRNVVPRLSPCEDVVARAGLDIFEKRVTGHRSTFAPDPVNLKKEVEDMVSFDDM